MSKLQILNVFLTERLTLAAQEIFKVVEDIFSEYNDEICRSRREIELLRKRLQQAGLQLDSGQSNKQTKLSVTLIVSCHSFYAACYNETCIAV